MMQHRYSLRCVERKQAAGIAESRAFHGLRRGDESVLRHLEASPRFRAGPAGSLGLAGAKSWGMGLLAQE